jgi:hypothetical protein
MFFYFHHIKCFWFYRIIQRLTPKFFIDNTYVGAYRLAGSSPVQHRGEVAVAVPQYDKDYLTVEQNLEGLMTNIPDMPLEEIPRRDQCHTVGVSASMGRFSLQSG